MILGARVTEQSSRPAISRDQQIERAIVVDIAVGRASCHARCGERHPGGRCDLFELSVAEIMKKVRRFRVANARLHSFDAVFNVSVRNVNIQPAVQIVVEKEATKTKRQQTSAAHVRLRRFVHEQPVALIVIKREHLVRKIRDEHARISGAVVISRVHSHSGAGDSILAVRNSRGNTFFRKRSVAVIYIQFVWLRVVAYQNVRPSVLIRVEHRNTKAF